MTSRGIGGIDIAIVAIYLVGITIFGLRFRRQQRTLRDYFLADRTIPWWAIALSIVAAETTTLTVISIPGLAFDTNMMFLQVVFGYLLARVVVSVLLIPQYFRGEMFTAYELMNRRFGARLRTLTAGLFLLTRAAAEGVRVFAVSIVIRIALGPALAGLTDAQADVASIAVVAALTLLYTFEGGLAAVIWTDVVQLAIYIGGTLVGCFVLLHMLNGGWSTVAQVGHAAGKFRIFDFTLDITRPYTFWAGIIGGTFLTTASHGTDQLMVQRLLAAKNRRESQIALLASGVAILLQFALFLTVGVMLYALAHTSSPALSTIRGSDRIFPYFIVNDLPVGIRGLMIAAIIAAAMSNLSAALNSLSSTLMIDFYAKLRPDTSETSRLKLSRWFTVAWGAVLFVLAIAARGGGRVVEVGLSIASVAYGALLGVFLLGTLTRRANERGTMIGMALGFATTAYVWLAPLPAWCVAILDATNLPHAGAKLAWTWYVLLGTSVTFAVGYLASLAWERTNERR